jgi:hypothetical protein
MPKDSYSKKRKAPRFSFIAEAEVTELGGARLSARVTDLSVRGCYVDTLSTFPVGTEVRLRISHGGSKCELPGKVAYTLGGSGMAVLFGEIRADQRHVLESWYAEQAAKTDGKSS